MTTRYAAVLRDRNGRALAGRPVAVYDSGTQNLSTLKSAEGVTLTNPLTTRPDGAYEFRVADGLYDILAEGERANGVLIGADSALAPVVLATYTVAALPATPAPGLVAYATDGRKNGEGGGSGTGVLVFSDSTNTWIACDSGAAVTA